MDAAPNRPTLTCMLAPSITIIMLGTYFAGDYESRSISVLKHRGHYQQIMNENMSVSRVLSR